MTIDFVKDYTFDPSTFKNHLETMEHKVIEHGFTEFKFKLETEADLIVLPRTFHYKMSIFDKSSKRILAFFNYRNPDENVWKLTEHHIYLELVLPYFNRGTYHEE